MLSDRLAQLLTGYIDGELSPRKERAVQKLLRHSSEARELLRQLEQDSREVQLLSRKRCEVDLAGKVMRTISERQLTIKPRPAAVRRFSMPAWIGYAAAAAVLVAVFYGSYQFSLALHGNKGTDVVRNQHTPVNPPAIGNKNQPNQPEVVPPERLVIDRPSPEIGPRIPDQPIPPRVNQPDPEQPIVKNTLPDQPMVPEPPTVEVVQAPEPMDLGRPRSKLEVFEAPGNLKTDFVVRALRDLDNEATQLELLRELHDGSSHRIELVSMAPTISFEKLERAFNEHGIGFTIDKLCLYRLQNPYWQTHFAVYLENVKPEEVVSLMTRLGQVDRKVEGMVLPFNELAHNQLSNLLGVDPTKLDPPKPAKIDIREPISKATLKQLRTAPPRPQANGVPVITRHALVVPCNPVHPNPSASREIKLFMERRTKSEPGTVQVLFLIRNVVGS